MSVTKVTITLTEAEASALWTLADMAGELDDTNMPSATYRAGRRAMDSVKIALGRVTA